jgi:hypothetical protein
MSPAIICRCLLLVAAMQPLPAAWPNGKVTVVEARVENGEINGFVVTPESRRKDIEILPAQ